GRKNQAEEEDPSQEQLVSLSMQLCSAILMVTGLTEPSNLDMAPDAFDDQYEGCVEEMERKAPQLLKEDFNMTSNQSKSKPAADFEVDLLHAAHSHWKMPLRSPGLTQEQLAKPQTSASENSTTLFTSGAELEGHVDRVEGKWEKQGSSSQQRHFIQQAFSYLMLDKRTNTSKESSAYPALREGIALRGL
ncbi:hypothetical protein A6R68_00924, partial [Neotoma lepida]